MSEQEHDDLRRLLQHALPRVNGEPRRDLWTAMSRRLEERQPRLAWYDWAAAGLAAGILAAFPDLVLVILYHL